MFILGLEKALIWMVLCDSIEKTTFLNQAFTQQNLFIIPCRVLWHFACGRMLMWGHPRMESWVVVTLLLTVQLKWLSKHAWLRLQVVWVFFPLEIPRPVLQIQSFTLVKRWRLRNLDFASFLGLLLLKLSLNILFLPCQQDCLLIYFFFTYLKWLLTHLLKLLWTFATITRVVSCIKEQRLFCCWSLIQHERGLIPLKFVIFTAMLHRHSLIPGFEEHLSLRQPTALFSCWRLLRLLWCGFDLTCGKKVYNG